MPKTGLAAQVGIGAQVDQTTRITPTRFYEFMSEGIKLDNSRVSSPQLRANKRVERHWRGNRLGAAGALTLKHPVVGAGLLWKAILGGAGATSTPVGATDARDHEVVLGSLDGDFWTVQVGKPGMDDSVHPFDYIGGKVTSASIGQSLDDFLQVELALDFYNELLDQTLATASYPADLDLFFYEDCAITLDSNTYEGKDFNFSIDNGLKTDRRYLRGTTLKAEQIEETTVDGRNMTGSASGDFTDLDIYSLYSDDAEFPVSVLWTSPQEIEAGFNYELEITLPRCRAEGETPSVGGPDILDQPLPFKVLQPSAGEPITVRVRDSLSAP